MCGSRTKYNVVPVVLRTYLYSVWSLYHSTRTRYLKLVLFIFLTSNTIRGCAKPTAYRGIITATYVYHVVYQYDILVLFRSTLHSGERGLQGRSSTNALAPAVLENRCRLYII